MNCTVRASLLRALATASERSFVAQTEYDRAVRAKTDWVGAASELNVGRSADRAALKALADHRQKHGC